jgi:uncharacterized protein
VILPTFELVWPFEECGRYFLFDGGSLGVAQVEKAVYEYVQCTKGGGLGRAKRTVAGTLDKLLAVGLLRAPLRLPRPDERGHGLEEAYLNLTDRCNLACTYCFNGLLEERTRRSMHPDVVRRSVDYLAGAASHERGLRLILWGGEPLLDKELLRLTLDYAADTFQRVGKRLMLATTTNATRIDREVAEWLAHARVVVNVSIDGAAASHDLERLRADGKGSYRECCEGILLYLEAVRQICPQMLPRARMTVTHSTAPCLFANHVHLWQLGIPLVWTKDVAWQPAGAACLLREDDYAILDEQFRLLREHILAQLDGGGAVPRWLYPQLRFDTSALHQRQKRLAGCGAGLGNVSIATNGDVVTCYHLEDRPEHRLGNVFDRQGTVHRWVGARAAVDEVALCRTCEFKYLCGGGCMAKGIARGLGALECWPSQCQFIKLYSEHTLRLYASLTSSRRFAEVRRVLAAPDVMPQLVDTGGVVQ